MRTLKFIILVILTVSMFFGCKKGENDPFLSLKSRKARLVGEWKLVEGSSTVIDSSNTDTYTFSETTLISFEGGVWDTLPYTETYTFENDGTYKYSSNTNNGFDTDDEEGVWTFGAKSAELDVKAKETVILYLKHYSSVYSGNTYSYTYDGTTCPVYRITLDMLKSTKMTLLIDYTYQGTSYSYTKTGTMTYEKQ